MTLNRLRARVLAGLVFSPMLAHAQEESPVAPSAEPPAAQQARPWLSNATSVGIFSHSADSVSPSSTAFIMEIERPLSPYFAVFAGGHIGVNLKAMGLQLGSRVHLSGKPYQGPFLTFQGDGTFFDMERNVSKMRASVSGLVGYSQQLGNQWHIALAAGAGFNHLRQETTLPLTDICPLLSWCLGYEPERIVETTEALHPVVRLTAVHRF